MLKTSPRPSARPAKLDTTPRATPVSSESAETSSEVAKAATTRAEFDPTEPMLLGTFGSDSDRLALLRLPNGRVAQVKTGDKVSGDLVVAIADETLTLSRGGRARQIAIP
ncbi:hypothetical protein [Mesobacterium pallidum]|uniref:hypothetical protein n=1 Tax=Mesobacterium pallidum TaxID=2872037 RepID=UPI001EE2E09B|nr:hypothetical protein [Mesobacterium pallidum]